MAKLKNSRKKSAGPVNKRRTKVTIVRRTRSKPLYVFAFVAIFAVIGTVLYLFSFAAPAAQGLLNGQNATAGKWCLHDDNTSATSPDPVDVAQCDGLATQAWFFTGFTIRDTAMSSSRCLQPAGGNTTVNATIVAAPCTGSPVQEWRRDGNSTRFINQGASAGSKANLCLALPAGNVKFRLGLRPCSAQYTDQNWTVTATVSVYQNPMRDASFVRWRIDQGVDYHGKGRIHFFGRAVIVQEVPPASAGWDGGWFTVYRLLDGDDAGKYVYVAEDCTPVHKVSNTVYDTSDTVCEMFKGDDGIETGWAAPPPDHDFALAHQTYDHNGHIREGLATNYGQNFSELMATLGAPNATGDISRSSRVGKAPLPANWPKW